MQVSGQFYIPAALGPQYESLLFIEQEAECCRGSCLWWDWIRDFSRLPGHYTDHDIPGISGNLKPLKHKEGIVRLSLIFLKKNTYVANLKWRTACSETFGLISSFICNFAPLPQVVLSPSMYVCMYVYTLYTGELWKESAEIRAQRI